MCQSIAQFNSLANIEYLYLHWPFCPYKCTFCPFVAFAGIDHYMAQYHQTLVQELNYFAQHHPLKNRLKTIFIGGGTPSTYPVELLLDMSGKIKDVFELDSDLEFSIEVNPGTVKSGQLAIWKGAGINRLSIGVQSLNDRVLQQMNRHQSARQVRRLLDEASLLFDNLSVDVIVGLPGITQADWYDFISQLVDWPIKHVSMYFLTVHENTMLYRGIVEGKVELPLDDEVVDMYYGAVDRFLAAGFVQYELSNFAKKGFESRHNRAYWDRRPYAGLGVGACYFDGEVRFQNDKNLLKYLKLVSAGCSAATFHEKLDAKQVWLEKLMLGMRRSEGVGLDDLIGLLNQSQQAQFMEQLKMIQDLELIRMVGDRICLTPKGLSVENEIIVRLSI